MCHARPVCKGQLSWLFPQVAPGRRMGFSAASLYQSSGLCPRRMVPAMSDSAGVPGHAAGEGDNELVLLLLSANNLHKWGLEASSEAQRKMLLKQAEERMKLYHGWAASIAQAEAAPLTMLDAEIGQLGRKRQNVVQWLRQQADAREQVGASHSRRGRNYHKNRRRAVRKREGELHGLTTCISNLRIKRRSCWASRSCLSQPSSKICTWCARRRTASPASLRPGSRCFNRCRAWTRGLEEDLPTATRIWSLMMAHARVGEEATLAGKPAGGTLHLAAYVAPGLELWSPHRGWARR